jgi:iron complex outermembrane receptor protein
MFRKILFSCLFLGLFFNLHETCKANSPKLEQPSKVVNDSLLSGTKELNAVVVTATRSKRGLLDVPLRVSVVGSSKVDAMPALSVDDYLRSVPGLNVSRGASIFGASTVSMRGMGNEAGRTLVMIDGVPVNKSDGGSVNWNMINAADVEQIEVLKGPGSSIHGGNAMGGVINIITPTPDKKIDGFASQTLGNFSTSNTQASISGRENNIYWGINGRYRLSDGYITTPADEIDEYTVESFLDEYQAGGRVGYFITPDQMIEVSGFYYTGQRGTGSNFNGYGFENEALAAPDGAFNQYTGLNGRVHYRKSFSDDAQLNVTVFGQRENYQNIRESLRNESISRYDVESIRDDIGLLSSYSATLGSNQILTAGIDVRNGSVDGADVYITATDQILNLGKMNQVGIFLQDEISFNGSPWSILAALRYDYASFYDGAFLIEDGTNQTSFLQNFTGQLEDASFSAISPRISLQYALPDDFRIYGGYSRGFRAPVLDDMCRTGLISGGMKLANPLLLPEYIDNFEIGGDVFLGDNISFSTSVFYSMGTDYHAYIGTGDSLTMNNRKRPIRIKDNIGKVDIYGAELGANFYLFSGFDLALSYSYVETEIKEFRVLNETTDDDLVGKQLVYQPRDVFHASLSWRNPVVNLFISFDHRSSQWLNDVNTEEIEAFSFVDLHLWRDIAMGFSLGVKVHNLLNQDFVDSRNLVAPGRLAFVELKYSF